jgi:dTDP-4-amino-4,6-dideoxygalactose transaminase
VGRPNIGDRHRFLERVNELLDRRWLTNDGPLVKEFEQRVASLLGVRHCVATCNGTLALELTIRALGLRGEVIVPSFTFVATAHALQWHGIHPVFVDVDPRTHTLDPAQVERAVTPETTGILGVHVWGRPCAIEALTAIAKAHQLRLVFDSAHAFACSYKGTLLGRFGDAEILSFHATKFFHTIEGGAVLTNDEDLAEHLRLTRNFGFAGYDTVRTVGTNAKMNEVCAAMGLTNLESLDEIISTNSRNYRHYQRALARIPGVSLMTYDEHERCNYQYIVVEVDGGRAGLERDVLMDVLRAENVLARRYFYPGIHKMEPYLTLYPQLLLPGTELVAARVLSLPTGTAITPDDIDAICGIIALAVTHADEIREAVQRMRAAMSGPAALPGIHQGVTRSGDRPA